MNTLIAGRGTSQLVYGIIDRLSLPKAVQGLGGGSVASLTYIIVSDLVSLRERGVFNSLLSMWAGFVLFMFCVL
jgi:MFS family permease